MFRLGTICVEPAGLIAGSTTVNRWVVIYDDTCPICRAGVEKLAGQDRNQRLELVPLTEAHRHPRARQLPAAKLAEALHVVTDTGDVYVGAEAMREIARVIPAYRWAEWILRFPIIRTLANPIYRWVAKHRHVLNR